jgi:hypothetical protein
MNIAIMGHIINPMGWFIFQMVIFAEFDKKFPASNKNRKHTRVFSTTRTGPCPEP